MKSVVFEHWIYLSKLLRLEWIEISLLFSNHVQFITFLIWHEILFQQLIWTKRFQFHFKILNSRLRNSNLHFQTWWFWNSFFIQFVNLLSRNIIDTSWLINWCWWMYYLKNSNNSARILLDCSPFCPCCLSFYRKVLCT